MGCLRRFPSGMLIIGMLFLTLGLTGCLSMFATEADPIEPTRTPIPTFTASPIPPTVDVAATEAAQAAIAQETAVAAETVAAAPTDTPVPSEPTATPTPDNAVAIAAQGMNVRSGPGTNYSIVGAAQSGDQYIITGKDPSGAWWQVDYNGQAGWLFGQLVTANNSDGVPVAQNIPAPPPPTNTPVPAPTQAPPPTAAPPPPSPTYKFNIVAVSKCNRQPAGNWFEGRTYINGQPANGYKVVFSYAADGPPITDPVISGPHPGYEGWDTGYYSHIINANGPKAGTWYVWVVDDSGNRISEIAQWTSTGPGEGCNQAAVDFDSR